MTRTQMCEKRADLIEKARLVLKDHEKEDGSISAESQQEWDRYMAEANVLTDAIKRHDAQAAAEATLLDAASQNGTFQLGNDGTRESAKVEYRSYGHDKHGKPVYTLESAGKRGTPEYREAFGSYLKTGRIDHSKFAALQSDDATQAGYLNASEQMAAGILKTVDDLLFVRQYATVHTVPSADSLGIRKRTAKLDSFNWSTELTVSDADTTLAYGKKVLTPHHLTGRILVSRDLLRRSTESIEMIVREEMARDAGEVMEDAYLTGNGAQKPLGVFVASTDGISTARDVNTGSTSGFTADRLIAAKYSLKQQYRNGGTRAGARWLFHRDGISKIAQLQDADDHYLLQPGRGLTGDEFDTLLGYPVDESERAPNTFSDGNYVGLLCNWRYYEIADSLDMEMQVLTELNARTNQVEYIGRLKTDGLPTLEEAFVRLKAAT